MATENRVCSLAFPASLGTAFYWEVRCSAVVSCFFLHLHSVILVSGLLIRFDRHIVSRPWSLQGKDTVNSSSSSVTMPTLKGLNKCTWLTLINIERWRQGSTSDATRTHLIVSLVWLFCFCSVRWPTSLTPWSWSSCLRHCSRAAWSWWPPPTEPLTVRRVLGPYVCSVCYILLRWINACLCNKCTTATHCFGKPAISDVLKQRHHDLSGTLTFPLTLEGHFCKCIIKKRVNALGAILMSFPRNVMISEGLKWLQSGCRRHVLC